MRLAIIQLLTIIGLLCSLLFEKKAEAQETVDQLKTQAEATLLLAQAQKTLNEVESMKPKEAEEAAFAIIRRAHYYLEKEECGVAILNQPLNPKQARSVVDLLNACLRIIVTRIDADTRQAEVNNRGEQGEMMTGAFAEIIKEAGAGGTLNVFVDTHEGRFAFGESANEAARDPYSYGYAYNGWNGAQAAADAILNPPQPAPEAPPANTAGGTRPPKIAPKDETPAPTVKERADEALSKALE